MVVYRDVGKRHGVYAAAVLAVILISQYTWALATVLTSMLLGIRWHHSTPVPFMVLTTFATPIVTGFCVKLSAHTWWYAAPIPIIGVPPWLFLCTACSPTGCSTPTSSSRCATCASPRCLVATRSQKSERERATEKSDERERDTGVDDGWGGGDSGREGWKLEFCRVPRKHDDEGDGQ